MEVKEVAKTLIEQGGSYLRHRSDVANTKNALPLTRESFNGKYIEMDFTENIAMKPKFEVQDAHFSGKQYSLHRSVVEPGTLKYFYHLSDDRTHGPEFVHEVLVDLFDKLSIKNKTTMIKSDNAPTQYKNKYAFNSMQTLSNDYNVKIVGIYGAAGHGKSLIDAMSSLGVKSILRREVLGSD